MFFQSKHHLLHIDLYSVLPQHVGDFGTMDASRHILPIISKEIKSEIRMNVKYANKLLHQNINCKMNKNLCTWPFNDLAITHLSLIAFSFCLFT